MTRLALAAALLGALIAGQAAAVCSCPALNSPAVAMRNADIVFAGTVVEAHTWQPSAKHALHGLEVKLHDWGLFHAPTKQLLSVPYDLRVTRAWKGTPPPEVTVFSGFNRSDCGALEPRKTYLVYARLDSTGEYSTHLCMGTRELALAAADLQKLGAGSPVAEPPAATSGPILEQVKWPMALIAIAVAVFAFIAWRLWRVA